MESVTATAIRRDVSDLVRVVDDAVERLPPADLTMLHDLLRRTLEEAKRLDAPYESASETGLVPLALAPERQRAYFPIATSPRCAVSGQEMAAADAGWAAARARGRSYRDAALRAIGPVLTPGEVATRLGVSAVTVNNWRRRRRLLAFRFDEHQYLYPAFQFVERPDQGERGLLRHLNEVLALLPYRSDWARVQFFLSPSPALSGRRPLDVLRTGDEQDIERLKQAAERAGDMGD
ncbi:MAG: DUF2384 domain-containing protein [Chloroflexi bacterium]|nr:DUF2384 domain-containing protein [Chloroflexota bacterium]